MQISTALKTSSELSERNKYFRITYAGRKEDTIRGTKSQPKVSEVWACTCLTL